MQHFLPHAGTNPIPSAINAQSTKSTNVVNISNSISSLMPSAADHLCNNHIPQCTNSFGPSDACLYATDGVHIQLLNFIALQKAFKLSHDKIYGRNDGRVHVICSRTPTLVYLICLKAGKVASSLQTFLIDFTSVSKQSMASMQSLVVHVHKNLNLALCACC